jgi:hypothetical protein
MSTTVLGHNETLAEAAMMPNRVGLLRLPQADYYAELQHHLPPAADARHVLVVGRASNPPHLTRSGLLSALIVQYWQDDARRDRLWIKINVLVAAVLAFGYTGTSSRSLPADSRLLCLFRGSLSEPVSGQ